MKKPFVIIILGPPGSGKGTQAGLLAEKFNLYHWETSKIINRIIDRAEKGEFVTIEGKKYYFEEERKLSERGLLWDPPFLVYFVKEKIKSLAKEGRGIALVGSPRTLYEGKRIIPLLKKIYGSENIKVISIKLSTKESIWRNSHRRECELMRHSILYNKETIPLTRCPLDGSKLLHRKDDNPEIIKTRLKEYRERTLPLVQYFREQGLTIIEVEGEQSVVDLFNDILKKLKQE